MFSFLKGIFKTPPTATEGRGEYEDSSSESTACATVISPYEWPFQRRRSTPIILPRKSTFADSSPPTSEMICSATVPVVLYVFARAIQRPIRHARDVVFRTEYLMTFSFVVGYIIPDVSHLLPFSQAPPIANNSNRLIYITHLGGHPHTRTHLTTRSS
jgi:hypothetical protein